MASLKFEIMDKIVALMTAAFGIGRCTGLERSHLRT